MRSLAPADYAALPTLERPAAYICVIRDVDSDRYRIEATQHPYSFIEALVAEGERQFGIELLSILETADIAASEARLFARHHATLSDQWLALDNFQLRELQKSELQVYAHRSLYISPGQPRRMETPASAQSQPALDGPPISRAGQRNAPPQSPARPSLSWHRYGANALKRGRGENTSPAGQRRIGLRETVDYALTDLWHKHPWKCLLALALLVLFSLAAYEHNCPNMRYPCPAPRPTASPVDRSPTPTASSQLYVVNRMASVRTCYLLTCDIVARWPAGTEVRSRGTRRGDAINGNDTWIIFGHNGRSVAVHSSYVTPKR